LDNVFGEGPWRNLKYEELHLKAYANAFEARIGIGQWFRFDNEHRPHQALGYSTHLMNPLVWSRVSAPSLASNYRSAPTG
jgi:transposase InsO family protein